MGDMGDVDMPNRLLSNRNSLANNQSVMLITSNHRLRTHKEWPCQLQVQRSQPAAPAYKQIAIGPRDVGGKIRLRTDQLFCLDPVFPE